MKTIALSLSLLIINNVHSAENLKWAQGPFWKAPQVLEMKKGLKSIDPDLVKSCESYNVLVASYETDGPTDILAQKFERFRKQALLSSMESSFKGRFIMTDSAFKHLLESEVDVSLKLTDKNVDILPMYTQPKAVTGVDLSSLDDLLIKAAPGSFTSFSRKLGLEDSNAVVSVDGKGQLLVVVDGRDLACDLISKKAILQSKTNSYVRLPTEAAEEIVNYYNFKVAPVIEKILSGSQDSTTVKAAKLGLRIGKLFEARDERYADETIEKQLGNLMGLLFIPKTLNPSSKLLEVNRKKAIDVTSSIDGEAVQVNLEVM